jgi:hypothetical protein
MKIRQNTKFHGPTLNGAIFASTAQVWKAAILNWLRYGVKNYSLEVNFSGLTSQPNFINPANWFKI